MLTYDLGKFRKARIWFETNSDLELKENENIKEYEFKYKNRIVSNDRTIIVELSIPCGGRITYGILGVEFKHKPNKVLTVKIPTVNSIKKYLEAQFLKFL